MIFQIGTGEIIKVLSYDPGAERCGWAALYNDEKKIQYTSSGLITFPRKGVKFQLYRVDLEGYYTLKFTDLIQHYSPDLIVNETIPSVGFNNSTQSYLANVVVSVLHVIAFQKSIPVYQIGSTTVKTVVAGNKGATKVKVRNAIIEQFPELANRKKDWVKIFDESDAIAVGSAYLQKFTM